MMKEEAAGVTVDIKKIGTKKKAKQLSIQLWLEDREEVRFLTTPFPQWYREIFLKLYIHKYFGNMCMYTCMHACMPTFGRQLALSNLYSKF